MKKLIALALLLCACAFADSLVFAPPAPGKVTIATTSGKITGTIAGNALPATAVVFNLVINGVPIAYTVPLIANQAYTESQNFTTGGVTDALTGTFTTNATGIITFSITLNGGAPVTGNF